MKKIYQKPDIKVIYLDMQDIVCTSPGLVRESEDDDDVAPANSIWDTL